MSTNLPALKVESGEVLANSRDVANIFGKRHDHVLRDIDQVLETQGSPDLGNRSWFKVVEAFDSKANRNIRSFDMTKDGFTLLVMGYTGPKAMQFKVAYINEFNRMEAELRKPVVEADTKDPVTAIMQAMIIVRRDQLALEKRMDANEARLAVVERALPGPTTHMTVLAYFRAKGIRLSKEDAIAMGRRCSRQAEREGVAVIKVEDPRYGEVNSYPIDILDTVFLIG